MKKENMNHSRNNMTMMDKLQEVLNQCCGF